MDLRAVELAALKPMTSLETDSDHSANSDLSVHICVFLWDYTLVLTVEYLLFSRGTTYWHRYTTDQFELFLSEDYI